jgi:microcystin-dependent protein
MTISISPVFASGTQFDVLGKPLAGGKLYAYEGGSSSLLKATYTNNSGVAVQNTNPIVLNSAGKLGTSVWLLAGQTYDLVLTSSTGAVIETYSYVEGLVTASQVTAMIAAGSGAYLPLTGGAVTGSISISGTLSAGATTLSSTLSVTGASTLHAVTATSVTATLNAASARIQAVATPTVSTDAATKGYVDTTIATGSRPAGFVDMYAGATAPTGWLLCDGASVSTTTYAALFTAIGYTYGGASGSFNLPDLRGQFLRGLDNGRGLDPGRTLGSAQTDAFKSHNHTINADNGGFNAGTITVSGTDRSMVYTPPTSFTGGTETRPVNVAINFVIKT